MRKISKKKLAVTGALTVVLAGTGTAAYAYWTSTGSGTGAGTTNAGVANLQLSQTSSTETNLYPGGPAAPVVVQVKNLADNNAYVATVSGTLSVTKAAGAVGDCDPTDYTWRGAPLASDGAFSLGWVGIDLVKDAAQSTSGANDKIGFNNKASNQDGCKGASLTFSFSAQ